MDFMLRCVPNVKLDVVTELNRHLQSAAARYLPDIACLHTISFKHLHGNSTEKLLHQTHQAMTVLFNLDPRSRSPSTIVTSSMAWTTSNLRRVAQIIDLANFTIPGGRWQLFEFCDLRSVPFLVKQCAQNTLTKHWTQRIPLLQAQAPAELAADVIHDVFRTLENGSEHRAEKDEWKVVDFCSGSGGPIPHIEKHVNALRSQSAAAGGGERRPPVAFYLSDLYPNIDAWLEPSAHSPNLSFIPDPVDATNPPFAAISSSTPGDKDVALNAGYEHDGRKVLRTFCLAFHHFDDEGARRVLKSTMETSDALVIFELQERRVGSCLLISLEFFLLYLVAIFWFPGDWLYLVLVYGAPVLPTLHAVDGLVSCLRTRTFEEFVGLLDHAMGIQYASGSSELSGTTVRRGDWVFTNRRILHTWPLGYMNATVGMKIKSE